MSRAGLGRNVVWKKIAPTVPGRIVIFHLSAHRRNDKSILTGGRAVRPALGDLLVLGPEADAFRPMLVDVAEARALPAAERVVGNRHRDRHVDTDHADIDPGGELARGVAVAGED